MSGAYPKTNVTLNAVLQKQVAGARKPLILAQGTSAGTFTSGALVTEVANGLTAGADLCGPGSIGQIMIDAFKEANPYSKLAAIIVSDNGSGVAATGTIVFAASSPAAGTFYVTVGSNTKNRYAITSTTSSTATTLGDALVAAITADENSPVTAVNTTGSVALTAKNKGTEGNRIGLRYEKIPAGITATLTALTSGATDPVLTGVLSKIDTSRYDIIAPLAFLSSIKTHLEAKFNVANAVLDGVGIVCKTDSYANLQTAMAPATLASQVINYWGNKIVNDADHKGGAFLELDYAISARFNALRSLRLIENSITSSFMTSGNDRGGAFMAGIPYHNMKMLGMALIPAGKGFTQDEIDGLADLGCSTFSSDDSGLYTVTNPAWLTCYKKETPTAIGFTYKDLNKNDCATAARLYIFTNLKDYYGQSALTAGDIPTNPKARYANEKSIRAYIVGLWKDLTSASFAILQGSPALLNEFKQNLNVVVDTSTGLVSGSMKFNVMGQLIGFDFILTPNN